MVTKRKTKPEPTKVVFSVIEEEPPKIRDHNAFEFSVKDFAAIVGVTDQTLMNWVGEGMPEPRRPVSNAAYYSVKTHLPWIIDHKWKPNQTARARKQEADAAIAEMTRDEKAGTLIKVSIIMQEYGDFFTRLRSNLMGFGDRLIPLLQETQDPREQLAIARQEMSNTLRELADKIEDINAS